MKISNNTVYISFGLILFKVLFSSCVKDNVGDTFYVEGRVLEYDTETPVANAKVFLWSATGEFLGPVRKTIIDTVRTNEHGEFRTNYKHTLDSKFLTSTADKYFKSGEFDMVNRNKQNIDIIIDPHAWLRVKVEKEGEEDPTDRFAIETFTCDPKAFNVFPADSAFTMCLLAGNHSHEIKYWRLPKGLPTLGVEILEVTLPSHDTTEVIIKF